MFKVTSPQVQGLFFKVDCGTCCNKSDKSRAVLQATAAKSLSLPLARFVFPIVGLAGASPASPTPSVFSELQSPPVSSPRSKSLRAPAHLPGTARAKPLQRDVPTTDRKERAARQTEALASCAGLRALREEEDGLLVGFLPHPAGLIAQLVGAYG